MKVRTRTSTLSLQSDSSQKSHKSTPPAEGTTNMSLYSLNNTSNGTLTTQHANSASMVEFTNVRPEEKDNTVERPRKGSRIKKFMHKVKKELDTESIHEKVKPDLSIQTMLSHRHSTDHKSPLHLTFNRGSDDTKSSFSDRLKLLNSTKYKNYNYHYLIKNKRDKGKAASKTFDSNTTQGDLPVNLTDKYINNYTVQELEMMIQNHTLSAGECNEYAGDIYTSIKQLIVPMFRGENMKYSLEDMTKLTSLYVRLRKCQESLEEQELVSPIARSSSSSSLADFAIRQPKFGSPFLSSSPGDFGSQTTLSPLIKIQSSPLNSTATLKEEFLDLMKHLMTVLINQLYYDDFKQKITFLRGSNQLLTKRKDTLSSIHQQQLHHQNVSSSAGSLHVSDMSFSNSTQSSVDLPVMIPTRSSISAIPMANGIGTAFPNLVDPSSNSIMASSSSNLALSNLGMLPLGTFEKCNSILWDFFESNIFYELTTIFIPLELENSTGHMNASKMIQKANKMKYGINTHANGYGYSKANLTTYTNALIHPEYVISNTHSEALNTSNASYPNLFETKQNNGLLAADQIGSLGEWSDVNIEDWILLAYRDFVVIPLYELNRNYEDVDCIINSIREEQRNSLDKYYDAVILQQCFIALKSIEANDTNQKLIENLLDQVRDKCSQIEESISS